MFYTLLYPECINDPGPEMSNVQMFSLLQYSIVQGNHVLHIRVHLPTKLSCNTRFRKYDKNRIVRESLIYQNQIGKDSIPV